MAVCARDEAYSCRLLRIKNYTRGKDMGIYRDYKTHYSQVPDSCISSIHLLFAILQQARIQNPSIAHLSASHFHFNSLNH